MKKILYYTLIVCLPFFTSNAQMSKQSVEKWKQEILDAETAFAKMVKEEGMQKAFTAFAADDAVLSRSNNLIIGKKAIEIFYENKTSKGLSC
jgi:hypothetical protein